MPFLAELACGRHAIAVGRLAHAVLGDPYVRHPSHGGASAFGAAIRVLVAERAGAPVGAPKVVHPPSG
jgi:hypothetical protein